MMKESRLHIVGLDALEEQSMALSAQDPGNPDFVNKGWFFMYQYKIAACPKRYSHDWGACPYAHPNESARRRDPQRFNYSSCICPNTGKGECPHGVECRYAHTLFEYWLHPQRFRTQMCKSGAACKRALCFFAHNHHELRQPNTRSAPSGEPVSLSTASAGSSSSLALLAAAAASAQHQQQPLAVCVDDFQLAAAAAGPAPAQLAHIQTAAVLDSSGSNVSASSCLQAASPSALDCSFGVADLEGPGQGVLVSRAPLVLAAPSLGLSAAPPAGAMALPMGPPGLTLLQQAPAAAAAGGPAAVTSLAVSMPFMDYLQGQQLQQAAGLRGMLAGSSSGMRATSGLQQHPMVAALMGQQQLLPQEQGGVLMQLPGGGVGLLQGVAAGSALAGGAEQPAGMMLPQQFVYAQEQQQFYPPTSVGGMMGMQLVPGGGSGMQQHYMTWGL